MFAIAKASILCHRAQFFAPDFLSNVCACVLADEKHSFGGLFEREELWSSDPVSEGILLSEGLFGYLLVSLSKVKVAS